MVLFAMAGIWEEWIDKKDSGMVINSFSIITTEANPLVAKIHNIKKRMPVILNKETEKTWLKDSLTKNEIDELCKPHDEDKMKAHTISKLITSKNNNNNVPEVMEKYSYSELLGPTLLF